MATAEDPNLRNPADAVKYAERACRISGYRKPNTLDTLAAAYAAVGDFSGAVFVAEKALKMVRKTKRNEIAEEIEKRLDLYKKNQPYTEASLPR